MTCIGHAKITDTDGDGRGDKTGVLATGFSIHIGYGGHDMHGPTMGYDGRIYWTIGDEDSACAAAKARSSTTRHGGMFRCEPDGSFEVFFHGLRNPQSWRDEYGNWFIVINDGDFGDERFHYLLGGTDTDGAPQPVPQQPVQTRRLQPVDGRWTVTRISTGNRPTSPPPFQLFDGPRFCLQPWHRAQRKI